VFSGKIGGARLKTLTKNKNAMVATEFEEVYAVQDFLVGICSPASIDDIIKQVQKNIRLQELEHGSLQLVADLVFQIFYIIYTMKTLGPYNHCDMHMHNVLLSLGAVQPSMELGGTSYSLKNPSGIRVKVIDLDTMTKVKKVVGRNKLCNTKKAVWSGTRKVLTQSNALLKSCKLSNAISDPLGDAVAKGNPISEQLKAISDPVDGDMYHFRWMLEVLEAKLELGIDMHRLEKVVDAFSEMRLPHYNKAEHITEYYKDNLSQLYSIVFVGTKLSQYVSEGLTNRGKSQAQAVKPVTYAWITDE
jgi:hypothetical protein